MFLSSTGLNQVNELLYLDSTRPWALKVFETLILSGSNHQKDDSLHGPGKAEDQESQDTARGPQCLSKFYEDLKEACLNWGSKSCTSAGIRWNHGGAYLNIINLFLCMTFLCVSKESDSSNDFEDTLDYTANEPLGGRLPFLLPGSLALPSKGQLRRVADMWSECCWVFLESPVLQRQLFRLGGLNVCSRLMTMVLQNLTSKTKEVKSKKKSHSNGKESPPHSDSLARTPEQTGLGTLMVGTLETRQLDLNNSVSPGHMEVTKVPALHKLEEEWPLQIIRLLEALLSISLHSSKSVLQNPESIVSFQVVNTTFILKIFLHTTRIHSCIHPMF